MVFEKPKGSGRFLLLYGTATGQAKAIAETIAEKAESIGLSPDMFELDDIGKKFHLEKEQCLVIVTSTTGDGDPPPNAEKFMRRIKKRVLTADYLAHLSYALLGLGDSNYSSFNRCARDMNTRLEAIGARKFYEPGFADDGVGLEVVADPWLEGLFPALQSFLGLTHSDSTAALLSETVPCPTDTSNTQSSKLDSGSGDTLTQSRTKLDSGSGDGSGTGLTLALGNMSISSSGDASSLSSNSANGNSASVTSVGNSSVPCNEESNHSGSTGVFSDTKSGSDNSSDTSSSMTKDKASDSSVVLKTQCNNFSEAKTDNPSSPAENSTTSNIVDNSESSSQNSLSNSDCLALRATNKMAARCSFFGTPQLLPETPCVKVKVVPSPLTSSVSPLSEQSLTVPVVPPPFLDVAFSDCELQLHKLPYQNGSKLPSAASDTVAVSLADAKVLTTHDALKKTLLVQLSTEDTDITYSPGDSISIVCPNNSTEVDLLIERLGLETVADQCAALSVTPGTKKRRAAVPPHLHPAGSSIRHMLTTCVSIRDTPLKAFIRAMVEHTSNPAEARRMQELCSKEGAQDYTRCLRQGGITLLDFLFSFPSCTPSVQVLLEHLPRLQPRPYSACSCQEVSPSRLDIVLNVVDVRADEGHQGHTYRRKGVCTGWLDDITSHLQQGQAPSEPIQIPVFVRTNQHFRPPSDLALPLIMVGPGTGVAPFVGFLEGRRLGLQQRREKGVLEECGEAWLYFGCRHRDKDFIFREKLEGFEADGTLTKLRVAFSRDPGAEGEGSNPPPPRYVQDLMLQDSAGLAALLVDREALVYVCGDATNMAASVTQAFEGVLQRERGMSQEDAHMFVMKKRIHKTYLEDVWA